MVAGAAGRYPRAMSRVALFRVLAVALGLSVALGAVAAVELRMRADETDTALRFPADEPGRKYALDPDEVPSLNGDGFNDTPFVRPKPEGSVRVALLGDSVAYGSGIPKPAVFPNAAEALLVEGGRPVEILNLAIYGYDAEQIAATMRHRGWELEPDLVVYAYFTNDHIPSTLLRVGDDDAPVFVGTSLPPGLDLPAADLLLALAPRSAMVRRWLGATVARHLAEGGHSRGDEDFFTRHLEALVADCAAHDVPLVVYGLPPHVLADPDPDRCNDSMQRGARFCSSQLDRLDAVHRQVDALGVPFEPALPWLRKGRDRSYYRDGVDDPHHPSAAGHGLFAEGLADLVRRWMDGEALGQAAPAARDRRRPRTGGGRERGLPDGAKGPPLPDDEAADLPPEVSERSNRPRRPDRP